MLKKAYQNPDGSTVLLTDEEYSTWCLAYAKQKAEEGRKGRLIPEGGVPDTSFLSLSISNSLVSADIQTPFVTATIAVPLKTSLKDARIDDALVSTFGKMAEIVQGEIQNAHTAQLVQ